MEILYRWVKSKRKSVCFLLVVLFLAYISPFISGNKYVLICAASATLIVPFLLLVIAVTGGKFYKTVMKQRWVAVLVSLGLVLYTALANIYAATVINDVFQVNSGLFPLTTIFLTFAYFIVNYLKWIVLIPYLGFFLVGVVIGVAIICMGGGRNVIGKRLFILCFTGIFLSATQTSVSIFESKIPDLVRIIAVKSDFSSKYRCTNFSGLQVKNVIFMPNGNVFAHIEKSLNGKLHSEFKILPCDVLENSNDRVN